MPEADPDTQRWAHVRWRDESGTVMKAVSQGWPLRKSAHPLLVVCGQADREIPLSQCRKLAAWANASLLEQPDASHVGVLLGAHAHATAEQVVAWLREAGLTP